MYPSSGNPYYASGNPSSWGTQEAVMRCRGCQAAVPIPQWPYHEKTCPAIRQLKGASPFMTAQDQRTDTHDMSAISSHVQSGSCYSAENAPRSAQTIGPSSFIQNNASVDGNVQAKHELHTPVLPSSYSPSHMSTLMVPAMPDNSNYQVSGITYPFQVYTPQPHQTGYDSTSWDPVNGSFHSSNDQEVSPGKKKANRRKGVGDIKMYDPQSNKFYSE